MLQDAAPFPGAWVSTVARAGRRENDWNAFTTALTAEVLRAAGEACNAVALRTELRAIVKASQAFLQLCAVTEPAGAYRFWPVGTRPRPDADVDDTALAHLALGSDALDGAAAVEYMRLFSAYRLTRGCRLHAASSWARSYPGAFGTWMDARDVVVDAGANANVVRLLHKSGARTVPGYRAAVKLLGSILSDGEPPTAVSPYYRSGAMLAWLCAGGRPDGAVAEESALHAAVERRLLHGRTADDSFATVLLTESAKLRSGLPTDSHAMARLFDQQCADGGWPEMAVCWNFSGTLRWTSRSVPSAVALELLVHHSRGNATC